MHRYNCLIHIAVDADDAEAVDTLLEKVCKATAKQEGVVFAYPTKAPILGRPNVTKPAAPKAPEELFNT